MKPILIGTTFSATTGATTAKPPTDEVTETAGVRIPSAMVRAVANNVCMMLCAAGQLMRVKSDQVEVDLPRSAKATSVSATSNPSQSRAFPCRRPRRVW